MQAIILAGGLGTRLKSVVVDKPKALSPVADRPFLDYVITFLLDEGVTDFVFSLGYLSNQILQYLSKEYPSLKFKYYIEDEPLGTGGAIKKALEICEKNDVLIVNADTFFDVPIQTLCAFHKIHNADCTIALKKMVNFDRYGSVIANTDLKIISFTEKKFVNEGVINGGFLFLKKETFMREVSSLEKFSFEKEFLEKNLDKFKIFGFESKGLFIDIGIPEDFEKAQIIFKNK